MMDNDGCWWWDVMTDDDYNRQVHWETLYHWLSVLSSSRENLYFTRNTIPILSWPLCLTESMIHDTWPVTGDRWHMTGDRWQLNAKLTSADRGGWDTSWTSSECRSVICATSACREATGWGNAAVRERLWRQWQALPELREDSRLGVFTDAQTGSNRRSTQPFVVTVFHWQRPRVVTGAERERKWKIGSARQWR